MSENKEAPEDRTRAAVQPSAQSVARLHYLPSAAVSKHRSCWIQALPGDQRQGCGQHFGPLDQAIEPEDIETRVAELEQTAPLCKSKR